jgi:hypothetical protein
MRFRCHRQGDFKRCSFPRPTRVIDAAAMCEDNLTHNRQTQTPPVPPPLPGVYYAGPRGIVCIFLLPAPGAGRDVLTGRMKLDSFVRIPAVQDV